MISKIFSRSTIITVVIVVLVAFAAGLAFGLSPALKAEAANTTNVSYLWVDLNGDGQVDLLVSGEVVFNTGFLALTPTAEPVTK